jgi:hypothetical protein
MRAFSALAFASSSAFFAASRCAARSLAAFSSAAFSAASRCAVSSCFGSGFASTAGCVRAS